MLAAVKVCYSELALLAQQAQSTCRYFVPGEFSFGFCDDSKAKNSYWGDLWSNPCCAVAFWLLLWWNVVVIFHNYCASLCASIAPIVYAKVNIPVVCVFRSQMITGFQNTLISLFPALTVRSVLGSRFAASWNHVQVFFLIIIIIFQFCCHLSAVI